MDSREVIKDSTYPVQHISQLSSCSHVAAEDVSISRDPLLILTFIGQSKQVIFVTWCTVSSQSNRPFLERDVSQSGRRVVYRDT